MSWRKVLIVPHLIREVRKAPRDASPRWDSYWADTAGTGDEGDVLWDSSTADEATGYTRQLLDHADARLPVVDVGCGNGRFTRALAEHFPRAVGVDLSSHAARLAEQESTGIVNVDFRALDMTTPGIGRSLRAELGEGNVFIRGVLHVLSRGDRRRLADNVSDLVGTDGTVLIAETNFTGSLLSYFESLGANASGIPAPLARAISAGIPKPSAFGRTELADCFPETGWEHRVSGVTTIRTVPMRTAGAPDSIPGYLAVLRRRG